LAAADSTRSSSGEAATPTSASNMASKLTENPPPPPPAGPEAGAAPTPPGPSGGRGGVSPGLSLSGAASEPIVAPISAGDSATGVRGVVARGMPRTRARRALPASVCWSGSGANPGCGEGSARSGASDGAKDVDVVVDGDNVSVAAGAMPDDGDAGTVGMG
jgi:hypothetical protein